MAGLCEQARVQLSIGREPGTGAGGTEGFRHAGDDADFAAAIRIGPALGDFAGVVGFDVDERHLGADHAHDVGRGHDIVHAPAVGGADVHEFDEAHDVAAALEAPRHRNDALIVDAFLDHHVDLDGRKARVVRCVDALQHIGHRKIDVVHSAEHGFIERIERDGEAAQTRGLERGGFLGQQRGVGGEGQIQELAVMRLEGGQHLDQNLKVFAQQRFAASKAEFIDAVCGEQARNARDFLKAQDFCSGQKAVVSVEH